MKNPFVRRLRKKERADLLAQASPAPDLKAPFGGPLVDFWRLPDGRIIEVWQQGGPAELWDDFERMKAFYDECAAFEEETLRNTRAESERRRSGL